MGFAWSDFDIEIALTKDIDGALMWSHEFGTIAGGTGTGANRVAHGIRFCLCGGELLRMDKVRLE